MRCVEAQIVEGTGDCRIFVFSRHLGRILLAGRRHLRDGSQLRFASSELVHEHFISSGIMAIPLPMPSYFESTGLF